MIAGLSCCTFISILNLINWQSQFKLSEQFNENPYQFQFSHSSWNHSILSLSPHPTHKSSNSRYKSPVDAADGVLTARFFLKKKVSSYSVCFHSRFPAIWLGEVLKIPPRCASAVEHNRKWMRELFLCFFLLCALLVAAYFHIRHITATENLPISSSHIGWRVDNMRMIVKLR